MFASNRSEGKGYAPPGVPLPGQAYSVELRLEVGKKAKPKSVETCTLNVHSQGAPDTYDTAVAKLKVQPKG